MFVSKFHLHGSNTQLFPIGLEIKHSALELTSRTLHSTIPASLVSSSHFLFLSHTGHSSVSGTYPFLRQHGAYGHTHSFLEKLNFTSPIWLVTSFFWLWAATKFWSFWVHFLILQTRSIYSVILNRILFSASLCPTFCGK